MAETEKRVKEQPAPLSESKARQRNSLSDREEDPKEKDKLEEAREESETSAHQPSNAVVMQPSASERSLRRTARVKTGK